MKEPIHLISLGAGVQSSTMALMAAAGKIDPIPSAAIFADTGFESMALYRWLDWIEEQLPFPIYRVMAKENRRVIQFGAHSQIPAYRERGIGKRQCTSNWKLVPLYRKCRALVGATRKRIDGTAVIFWIGISLDEVHRMKPSREPWLENRWPLIEQKISRAECLKWIEDNGYPHPPRSACVFCPYKSDAEWRETRKDPEQMRVVRQVEALINPKGEYLHRDKLSIDEVDLSTDTDRGQMNLFGNECEGMCGV